MRKEKKKEKNLRIYFSLNGKKLALGTRVGTDGQPRVQYVRRPQHVKHEVMYLLIVNGKTGAIDAVEDVFLHAEYDPYQI